MKILDNVFFFGWVFPLYKITLKIRRIISLSYPDCIKS